MDLKKETKINKNFKIGDKIISLQSFRTFTIKYMLGDTAVVNNGIFDFPLRKEMFIPHSSLMEVLL